MLDHADKIALIAKSEDYFLLAERFFDRKFKRPEYLFNQRGRAAGTAHLHRNWLKLNPILFLQNRSEFFEQVIPHEVAHLITFQFYGKVRPHGQEWQAVMQCVFKKDAVTTHSFNIDDVIGKLFMYACECQSHKLTIRRHNKVLKGERYLCRRCKSSLKAI